jgi:hypothetical protein
LASSDTALSHERRSLQQVVASAEADKRLEFGAISYRKYPFMTTEHLQRSPALVEKANSRFRLVAARCSLRVSDFGIRKRESNPISLSKSLIWKSVADFMGFVSQSGADILGLFATSNMQKGDIIFVGSTSWGATSIPASVKHKFGSPARRRYVVARIAVV